MAQSTRLRFLNSFLPEELNQLYLLITFHPKYKLTIAEHLVASKLHQKDYKDQYRQFPSNAWAKNLEVSGQSVDNLVEKTKEVLRETADWLAQEAALTAKAADQQYEEQRVKTRDELAQQKREREANKKGAIKRFWAIINHPPGWSIRHKEAGETIVTEHAWKRFVGRCFGAQEKEQIAEQPIEFYVQALKDMFQRSKLAQWDPEAKRKIILHNLDEGRHWTDYYLDDQTNWLFAIVRSDRLKDKDKMVILTVYRYHPETHTVSEE
ncbi:MAG: hypothetical protein G01um101419_680 [Parcubacteria group bacterium Gr01-1014_19]|nr:MAG: hypothetical protein G01um101419_680 [Parcubacteria group bacterium Gr01-1014_19]